MLSVRLQFLFAVMIVAILLTFRSSSHGQDKPDMVAINKKKTAELLEKAQEEYRVFFKKPETAIEFWAAIKFEMDLGKFDLAGLHLKMLLEKDAKDVDPDLVRIEEAEGLSAFLRLQRVRQWSEHPPFHKEAANNVEILLTRLTKAVESHLSNSDRIKKFIKQLDAQTPEERGYAYVQLAKSGHRAVPYLIEALQVNYGKALFSRLRETLLRMGPETVPVYLEVFKAANEKDARGLELRLTLLDLIQQRDDKRVVPYLWHMSAAKQYPEAIRKKAKEVLAALLRVDVSDLPPAKETLTQMAERFYQHKVPFPAGKPVQIWEWNGEAISLNPLELTPDRAEEVFGTRYAREALDLAPGYQPAQVVLLSLMLERAYRPKVDQILMEPLPPKLQQLLTTIDADLLMRVLDRGMEDRQLSVVLPAIQAGERGEFRTARAGSGSEPRGIARGLYYPDRRVQFASLKAMVNIPASSIPAVAADRIVDLSRRFLASEAKSKALIVGAPAAEEAAARKVVEALGLDSVIARTVQDAIAKGKASADYDLVVLYRGMADPNFPHVYSQIRQNADLGGLPMFVIVDPTPGVKATRLEDQMLAGTEEIAKAQARWEKEKGTFTTAPLAIKKILDTDPEDRDDDAKAEIAKYFRQSWEKDERKINIAPASIRQILEVEPAKRDKVENRELEIYFRSTIPEFRTLAEQIAAAHRQPDPAKATRKFLASNPNAIVISQDKFRAGEEFKFIAETHFARAQIVKLTPDERKMFAAVSMGNLWRMARNDLQGYDVTPALDVIKTQSRSPEFSLPALEILGRMPGKDVQSYLARIVGDPAQDLKTMRLPGVFELNRHLQKFGVLIDKKQVDDLKRATLGAPDGSPFRAQMNVTASMISRASAPRTGDDLRNFRPDPPAPPKEKEEKKDKDN